MQFDFTGVTPSSICLDLLVDVTIACSPDDCKCYAERFYELGLQLPEDIRTLCTANDVNDVEWMRKFHKVTRSNLSNLLI
jgi:hypothetical protein